ncbi:hypothetical protein AVDCRST_MAG92-3347, partial [uncultured Coleofasciculus sp.]
GANKQAVKSVKSTIIPTQKRKSYSNNRAVKSVRASVV